MEVRGAKIDQEPCLPLGEQPEAPVGKVSSVSSVNSSPASPKRQGGGQLRGILRGNRPTALPGVMTRRKSPAALGGEDSTSPSTSPLGVRRVFSSDSIKDSILSPLSSISGRGFMKRITSTGSSGGSQTSPKSPGSLRTLRSRLARSNRSSNGSTESGEAFSRQTSPTSQSPNMGKTLSVASVASGTSASGGSNRTQAMEAMRRRVNFCPSPKNTVHDVTPYGKKYGVHPSFFNFDRKGDMRLTDDGVAEDLRRQEAGDQPLALPGETSETES